MKKIIFYLVSCLSFFVFINISFAEYTLSEKDTSIIYNATIKIESLIQKKGENYRAKYIQTLKKIKTKNWRNERITAMVDALILSLDQGKTINTSSTQITEAELVSVVKQGNDKLPIVIGAYIRFDKVSLSDREITYHYTIINIPEEKRSSLKAKAFHQQLESTIQKITQGTSAFDFLRTNNIAARAIFQDEYGNEIFNESIDLNSIPKQTNSKPSPFSQITENTSTTTPLSTESQSLQEIEKELNRSLPKMIDEITRLDKISVISKTEITFNYTIISGEIQKSSEIENSFRLSIIYSLQTTSSPLLLSMEKDGVIFNHNYRNISGTSIANITIKPEDYRGTKITAQEVSNAATKVKQSQLQEIEKTWNSNLPMKLGEDFQIDKIKFQSEKELTIFMSILSLSKSDLTAEEIIQLKNSFLEGIKEDIKTSKDSDIVYIKEHQTTVNYELNDKNGTLLFKLTIIPGDYR